MSDSSKPGRLHSLLDWTTAPAVLAVVVLMVHTVLNTGMRLIGMPMGGTLEYAAYWYMPLIAFLGVVAAQRNGEQVEATLFFDRMPAPLRREFLLVGYVFMIAISLGYAWYGWQEAVHSAGLGRTSGASEVAIWPMMFAVPLGYMLLVVQLLIDVVQGIRSPVKVEHEAHATDRNPEDEGAVL